MKFIEDYLGELFGCEVCNVKLDFHSSGEIAPIYRHGMEDEALSLGRGMTHITLEFYAFDNNLPMDKGSLRGVLKERYYSNMSLYRWICLRGEETNKLFEYAMGKEE